VKEIGESASRSLLIIYRVLLVMVIIIALSLLAGTIFTIAARPDKALSPNAENQQLNNQALSLQEINRNTFDTAEVITDRIFSGIGRLRFYTAPPEPATVILSIAFPYNPEDKAFSEELASRIRDFRRITEEYFASLTVDELRLREESLIKSDLLGRYNAVLRLGHITALLFDDFMILQ
jgi:flagellar basal body-associated protein FliL